MSGITESASVEDTPTDIVTPPRVWPLFVLSLVELVFAALLQGIAAAIVLFASLGGGQSIQDAAKALPERMMQPPMFILMLVMSGVSMIVGGFVFGWISARNAKCSVKERLGLAWPSISPLSLMAFLVGSVPVLLVSVFVVVLIEQVVPGDTSILILYENMTNGWAIVFIILIGVLPGFGEELFFRGFFQRRMLERFNPAVAIGITSVVFGLFHITPHGIALATIIGIWLGVIAWRTNSIWPSACCHAFINSGWNVYQVGRFQWDLPEIPPVWFSAIGGVIVLAAFAWSVRVLLCQNTSVQVTIAASSKEAS